MYISDLFKTLCAAIALNHSTSTNNINESGLSLRETASNANPNQNNLPALREQFTYNNPETQLNESIKMLNDSNLQFNKSNIVEHGKNHQVNNSENKIQSLGENPINKLNHNQNVKQNSELPFRRQFKKGGLNQQKKSTKRNCKCTNHKNIGKCMKNYCPKCFNKKKSTKSKARQEHAEQNPRADSVLTNNSVSMTKKSIKQKNEQNEVEEPTSLFFQPLFDCADNYIKNLKTCNNLEQNDKLQALNLLKWYLQKVDLTYSQDYWKKKIEEYMKVIEENHKDCQDWLKNNIGNEKNNKNGTKNAKKEKRPKKTKRNKNN